MIIDTMSKYEVMDSLRKEFDKDIYPYYQKKILPKLQSSIYHKCQRENRMITIGWEEIPSSPNTKFVVLKRGNKESDKPLFINVFRWNNKKCYANFFPEQHLVVYQAHCLQRYAERVLQKEVNIEKIFFESIVKHQASSFNITLPTPTHKFSQYFGLANALFLGDFDESHPKTPYLWLNTCISFNESGYSQSKIMTSLHEMQNYVEKIKIDFSEVKNKKNLKVFIKKNSSNQKAIEELKKYLIQKILLWKLHLSFNFEFTELFRDEIEIQIKHLKDTLLDFGIHIDQLSPFSLTHGIAKKGEIDYIDK